MRKIAATYNYRDRAGKLLFQVVRYEPKDFRQRRPDGKDDWIWNLHGTPRVLYRLPELLAADPAAWVFVVEGEKDTDALVAIGLVATTCPMGASKWLKVDDSPLEGHCVCIIPDRDEAGEAHAHQVANSLNGRAADLRILHLAFVKDFTGNDVSDFLDWLNGAEPAELAAWLIQLAESAPTPPTRLVNTLPATRHKQPKEAEEEKAEKNGNGAFLLKGKRDEELTSIGGKLRRNGLNEQEIEKELLAINSARCRPPMTVKQVRKIAKSVARYEPASHSDVFEADNRYCITTGKQSIPISNFLIKPTCIIESTDGAQLDAMILIGERFSPITFAPGDWRCNQAFRAAVNRVTGTVFTGTSNHVQHIRGIIMGEDRVPRKRGVSCLGFHTDRFLMGNMEITHEGVQKNPAHVYVFNGQRTCHLLEKLHLTWLGDAELDHLVKQVCEILPATNEPSVVVPNVGWYAATPFKSRLHDHRLAQGFPILAELGSPESGKTERGKVFARMLGSTDAPLDVGTTPFVLLRTLSSTNTTPIVLDEYKPAILQKAKLDDLHHKLHLVYNSEQDQRGRPDQTTVAYPLVAPVVLLGEGSLHHQALMQRVVPICPRPVRDLPESCRAAFERFRALPLTGFAARYLAWSLGQDVGALWEGGAELLQTSLPDTTGVSERQSNNLQIVCLGLVAVERFLNERGFRVLDQLDVPAGVRRCVELYSGNDLGGRSVLDQFVDHVLVMISTGYVAKGIHYDDSFGRLFLRLDEVYAAYRKFFRESNMDGELADKQQIRRMLRENVRSGGFVRDTSANHPMVSPNNPALPARRCRCVELSIHALERAGFDTGALGGEVEEEEPGTQN